MSKHLEQFQAAVEAKIAKVIECNVEELAKIYTRELSGRMKVEDLRTLLSNAFQTKLNRVVHSMRIRRLYKGITYDSLKDEAFIAVARKAFPDVVISEEFDAARERSEPAS